MNGEKQRRSLYEKYSQNWQIIRSYYNFQELEEQISSGFARAVMCPICMRIFNDLALNQNSERPLTIEHCPPEELGGKPSLLLCKHCNSKTGHDLDVKLMNFLNVEPFNAQVDGSSVELKKTKLISGDIEVGGKGVFKRNSGNSFSFKLLANDAYRRDLLEKINYQNEIQIIYAPHVTPSAHLVQTALLKIGYLLAFKKFGHYFILNPNYAGIRSQLLNPDKVQLITKGTTQNIGLPVGFYFIRQPLFVRGLLVVFELSYNDKVQKHGVFINDPSVMSTNFYSHLKVYEGKTFAVDAERIRDDLDFLTKKRNIGLFIQGLQEPVSIKLERLGLDFF